MQAITSGSLAALSDITAQKLVSNAPLNWRRTLAMALFGLVWSGPSNHYWQKFTNQLFKGKKDVASVVQKVGACQLAQLLALLITAIAPRVLIPQSLHLLHKWCLNPIMTSRCSLITWCTAQCSTCWSWPTLPQWWRVSSFTHCALNFISKHLHP